MLNPLKKILEIPLSYHAGQMRLRYGSEVKWDSNTVERRFGKWAGLAKESDIRTTDSYRVTFGGIRFQTEKRFKRLMRRTR